jgi:uncharacterized phage protein (TIGR01671 family)
MKEIKFRAWDKKNKQWLDTFNVILGTINLCEDVIYMQYIGLKDKNGKEIYEGDVVRFCTKGFHPEVFITTVEWDKCAFRLGNGRQLFYFGQVNLEVTDDGEIIGNIYENPELLEALRSEDEVKV